MPSPRRAQRPLPAKIDFVEEAGPAAVHCPMSIPEALPGRKLDSTRFHRAPFWTPCTNEKPCWLMAATHQSTPSKGGSGSGNNVLP